MSAACSRRSALTGPPRRKASTSARRCGTGPMPAMARRTSSKRRPARVELDQRREAHERDHQRAAVADLLEAAAVAGQRVAFDGDQDFAGRQRGLAGAGHELARAPCGGARSCRRAARPARRCASCAISGGRAVGGRRGIDDIAADGGGFPDLVVGEPHRAARHAGQRAGERRDRRGSAGSASPRRCARARRRRAARCSSGILATSISTGISTSPARPSRAHGSVSVAPATMR